MADLESAGAVHKERQGAVPKELREPGALTNAIEAAQRSLQRMEAALETARTKLQGAKETHARCVESEKQTKARSVEARRAAEETARELRERLQRLGFVDEADLSTAMQSDVELDDLANRVRTSEQAVAAACDRLARARKSADGLENPDMEAHTEAVKAAQVALSEHMTALGEQGERLKQRTALSSELNDLLTANTEQEREYGVLARLAQVAAGKGSSEQNLTFERYVLSTLLEEVLVAATRRLLRMSRGRFELLRAGTLQDKRKAGGLDLEVFDAHTGHTRPVSTLSGGEGFQASLALALGLADVVQSHSGGIRLDAIFIDEGFGTLDPEMLDLAIRTLQDLQKHGRLVGIISHVPELKESIDVRLELHSSKQGSSARFVLP